jgi:Zn-dependent M28 family amino/carboxypeptidase
MVTPAADTAPRGLCRRRILLLPALLLLLAAAVRPDPVQDALRGIRPDPIRAHLAFLADDMLEGRSPGSRGASLAARYIAGQLLHAGVSPVRGSQYHTVPLNGWRADPRRVNLEFAAQDQRVSLRHPQDAVVWLASGADTAAVAAELVFVGYGVRAPEYGWDDFKGRDVRGRILVMLINDPPAPPGQPVIFDGAAMTYYGRWTYKLEEAARQGAAGVLLVHTDDGAGYPWSVVQTSFGGEQLLLPLDPRQPPPLQLQGWVTFDAARRLFAAGGHNLDALFVRAARRDFQPVATGIDARLRVAGVSRQFESANVVGLVNGRHPQRRGEYVVYTAHYDGLGIGRPVDGDSIYNGAYDNASGVALLLEIARAFATMSAPPERSILFIFTTAEEAGLLGSSWYIRQPLVPLQRTVAALNIDGANLWGETNDVSAVGLERSTLGLVVEAQAAALGLRVSGERAPQKGFFFRSDHFPFARAGIPALFLDHGADFRGRPPAWGEALLSRVEAERYHLPADRYDPSMDLAGAVQQARHAFLMGLDIANTAAPPRWYPGGEVTPR